MLEQFHLAQAFLLLHSQTEYNFVSDLPDAQYRLPVKMTTFW